MSQVPFIVCGIEPYAPDRNDSDILILHMYGGLVDTSAPPEGQGATGEFCAILLSAVPVHRRFVERAVAELLGPEDRVLIVSDYYITDPPQAWVDAEASGAIDLIRAEHSALAITDAARIHGMQWLEDILPACLTTVLAFRGQTSPVESMLVDAARQRLSVAGYVGRYLNKAAWKNLQVVLDQLGDFRLWTGLTDDSENCKVILRGMTRDRVLDILASLARELSLVLYDGGRIDDPESHEFLREDRPSGVMPSAWRQVT